MKLQQLLDISHSGDMEVFERRLAAFSDAFEFEKFNAIVIVDKPGQELALTDVGNTPKAYSSLKNVREMATRSPVMQRLKKTNTPFAYNQDTYVKNGSADIWETQAAFGYKTGIAVALHLQNHAHFLIGLDRRDPLPQDVDDLTQMMATLQLFAVHAQDAAIRLLLPRQEQELPKLTTRELNILRWTKDGKSSWAVGEILGISESTVNFHIRNSIRKLKVSSKHQAVLKAMSFGLVE